MTIRILIACELSAKVRNAFAARGFIAVSCDTEPSDDPTSVPYDRATRTGNHYQGDVLDILNDGWDAMIAFPPCTHLAVSGAKHFAAKIADGRQQAALDFVRTLLNASIKYIALENPVSIISGKIRKPSQYVQPWQFGHGYTKKTGLWLKNLPLLVPTNIVAGRSNMIHMMASSKLQAKKRSETCQGIADAMAQQWGDHIRG